VTFVYEREGAFDGLVGAFVCDGGARPGTRFYEFTL
jgi:hypothetical protein